ncbi:MAG: hypothetical protein WBV91_21490 [Desulfobacterales bacterium]
MLFSLRNRIFDTPKMKFTHQNYLISIVDDETLYFVEINSRGESNAVDSIALEKLFINPPPADIIPASIRDRKNSLLIVPDYWLGNSSYKFQSRTKSLADAFVARKLNEQFPDQPEIKYFFDGTFYKREQTDKWVYAYFLQDPQFFKLYPQLAQINLQPHRITSPALIWQQKIRQEIPDFDNGGKGFVQLLPKVGLLYFFFEGNFLFSRRIPLGGAQSQSSDNYEAIAYELNQSLYLFSQKAKTEIDKLYLVSHEEECGHALSEVLGREIHDLNYIINNSNTLQSSTTAAGAIGFLSPSDILPGKNFLSLCHRVLKKELEWKPVQFAGMAVGLILLFLLGLETTVLHKWSQQIQLPRSNDSLSAKESHKIQQYNEALNAILSELERRSPQKLLRNIAKSLPPNVRIQELVLETEDNPGVNLKGVIRADNPEHFKACLSTLIANVNENIQGRRAMTVSDIDFEVNQTQPGQGVQDYFINFRLDL